MEGGLVVSYISFVIAESISIVPLRSFICVTDVVSLIVGEGEGRGHRPGRHFARKMAPRS